MEFTILILISLFEEFSIFYLNINKVFICNNGLSIKLTGDLLYEYASYGRWCYILM